jgi:hypothetical protein
MLAVPALTLLAQHGLGLLRTIGPLILWYMCNIASYLLSAINYKPTVHLLLPQDQEAVEA